jgi:copper(I)-binding protein
MRTTLNLCAILFALLLAAPLAHADDIKVGDLILSSPWTRATPKGASTGGGYLTIQNNGQTADRLVGVSSPAAAKTEVHQMSMEGGVMRMRPVQGGLAIEPGKAVTLAPSGYHIMLQGLKAPFAQGDKISVVLEFEKAGKVDIQFDVLGMGATQPPSGEMKMPGGMKM